MDADPNGRRMKAGRARGRPRVPWGQDPRAQAGIPLRWQLDTRRIWGSLAEQRRTGRAFPDVLEAGLPTDRSALASAGRDDPASSAEVLRWSTGGSPVVDAFDFSSPFANPFGAFELARFVSPWAGVGVIEKIQTFTRVQVVERHGEIPELVTIYEEGPLSTPIPALTPETLAFPLQRVYALTLEALPEPPARSAANPRVDLRALPPGSVMFHPYSWADARYATSQILGHNQRIIIPRRSCVRLWALVLRTPDVEPDPPSRRRFDPFLAGLYTFAGYLAGFSVAAGPTSASYPTATLRGT